MASRADVRRVALSLPQTVENDTRFAFSVLHGTKRKSFVWVWMERIETGKPRVPNPAVMAIRVADQTVKELLLASDATKFFTEPHYAGFPAVLVRLAAIPVPELEELLVDAWRCQAPRALAREHDRGFPQQAPDGR
jgi:hypothetical protein